ncbi:MAG: cupin domain-containing protein [Candidatus Competibacterales bacterium]
MKPAIKPLLLTDEFYTAEGCYIIEQSNDAGDPALSMARARVAVGVTTRWHCLVGTAERYYILAGEGWMEVGGLAPGAVRAGDVVLIPPHCPQRITNTGTEDLLFLAICSPPFVSSAYRDLGDGPSPTAVVGDS